MKKLKTMLFGVGFASALCLSAFAANLGGATVDASALNLRKEASTESAVVTVVPRGSAVVVAEKVGEDWMRVIYKGSTGYMASEFLNFSETLNASFGTGTIKGSSVRLRDGAALSSNTIAYYNSGTTMTVTGVSGGWYAVNYNGVTGYVSSDYMTLNPAETVPAVSVVSAGQKLVDAAMKYLNTPYVWGGTSPNGFDCSGFVYYVCKECGYSTNRTAASLYSNGVAVERSDLQPGDILCFTNGSGSYIGHTGIYIGSNQFIHASSGCGYVTISGLSETYYNTHYYGARRIA